VKSSYRLACCAIVFIVLLRIGIGWHFFYEGVHKFDPAAGFSSEGFLGIAKGPTADLYYWMLPDLDGIQRIEIAALKDENGKEYKTFVVYENAWKEYFEEYLKAYPDVNKDEAQVIFNRYLESLRAGAADTEKDVNAFLKSRERFRETRKTIRNTASFEQERRWNLMMQYRREAAAWTQMLTEMGNGLQSDLGRLADPELAGQRGQIVTAPEKELIPLNKFTDLQYTIPKIEVTVPPKNEYTKSLDLSVKSRMELMDMAVMLGLSAIGLCMILGFCTRLACLGGAAFLVNVILTTFPVPGIYPEIPSMIGNFMFVSKDVVELLALLVLVCIPSGRWGGLDYFLWNYGGKQIVEVFCPCASSSEEKQ
jgi:uncharacterized membrane protein YphA (DoxX/SURF4 family)